MKVFTKTSARALLVVAFILSGLMAQQTVPQSKSHFQMAPIPDAPGCFLGGPERGDPSKEASIMKMKGSAGCMVPWHWHPSTENIMMISGTARTQVKGEKPTLLHAGSFLSVPPKHVMNFVCTSECALFLHTDGPFATHYVDEKGKEITPAAALKSK